MAVRYWVHRNDSEPAVTSRKLFLRSYLSIGWQMFAHIENLREICLAEDQEELKEMVETALWKGHEKYSIRNFMTIAPGDIVMVLTRGGEEFNICRVKEAAVSVRDVKIKDFKDDNDYEIVQNEDGYLTRVLPYRDPQLLDIGFLIKIDKLTADLSRARLSKKMKAKIQGLEGTNGRADDFADEIEKLIREFA